MTMRCGAVVFATSQFRLPMAEVQAIWPKGTYLKAAIWPHINYLLVFMGGRIAATLPRSSARQPTTEGT